MGAMPYTVLSIRPVFSEDWVETCPTCKAQKKVTGTANCVNVYGCYDGTYAIQFECGHLAFPWERIKNE